MELRMFCFCTFFFVVVSSSAADNVKTNLTGTEGGNITLPDSVPELGFLSFRGNVIAMVNGLELDIVDNSYMDRVLWNQNTRLFTLIGLQRNDTGDYKIENKGRSPVLYELTVYATVPTPAVRRLSVGADSCTLLCLVEPEGETTLRWYSGEEVVNQSSHAVHLPLTVHQQNYSSPYTCAAANLAEEKDVLVDVQSYCSGQNNTVSNPRHYVIAITITIVIVTLAVFITVKTFLDNSKTTRRARDSVNEEQEVQYTELQIHKERPSQEGSSLDSQAAVCCSLLTSVCYKVEAHGMVLRCTADTEEV